MLEYVRTTWIIKNAPYISISDSILWRVKVSRNAVKQSVGAIQDVLLLPLQFSDFAAQRLGLLL